MPSKVLMDVEEYLHATFDGPDCEYLDGEVVERNMGELPHGILQGRLIFLLMSGGRAAANPRHTGNPDSDPRKALSCRRRGGLAPRQHRRPDSHGFPSW